MSSMLRMQCIRISCCTASTDQCERIAQLNKLDAILTAHGTGKAWLCTNDETERLGCRHVSQAMQVIRLIAVSLRHAAGLAVG